MGRPNKQERQVQRGRERVQSLLARGRVGDAADALLALPRAEREFAIASVGQGMERDVSLAYAEGTQPVLLAWLVRVEREPRLLPALAARGPATQYALFSAALRARMWAPAEMLWAGLREPLAGHELFEAIDAFVSMRGDLPAELLARLEADAQRLGYDAAARPSSYPAPSRLDEVDAYCLRCFGCEPWPRFREVTLGWLRSVPADCAQRLRLTCAALSERELLLRGRGDGRNAGEVVRYIAALAADSGAPPELEPLVELSLRISYRALIAAAHGPALDVLVSLATVALRYESLRGDLATILLSVSLEHASRPVRVELLRIALAADGRVPALLAVAYRLYARAESEDEPEAAPPWLVQAFESALDDAPALAAGLRSRLAVCRLLLEILPIRAAIELFDRLWEHASEPVREALAAGSGAVFDRMKARPNLDDDLIALHAYVSEAYPEFAQLPKAELRRMLTSEFGSDVLRQALATLEADAPIQTPFEPMARALAARAAPYDLEALDRAIKFARGSREASRAVDAHLARLPTLPRRVHALLSAVRQGLMDTAGIIEKRLYEGLSPSAAEAAKMLLLLERADAPRRVRKRAARVLLEALEREPDATEDAEVARAASVAKRRVKPRRAAVKRAPKVKAKRATEQLEWAEASNERR